MPLLDSPSDSRRSTQVLYVLFSLLVLVAPFYYQDNLGGEGLGLPFNASIWLPTTMLIGSGIFVMLQRGVWMRPAFLALVLLLPALLIVAGFTTGIGRPAEWVVRLGVVVGACCFGSHCFSSI
jgi:O-antigen polymerase